MPPHPTAAYQLEFCRVRFALEFTSAGQLPTYPGSALRGLLGHGLRRLGCLFPEQACTSCPLAPHCDHLHFFDTPGNGRGIPLPWLLDFQPPANPKVNAGDRWHFQMHVLGPWRHMVHRVRLALETRGRRGLGNRPLPFKVAGTWIETHAGSGQWAPLPEDSVPTTALVPPSPPSNLLVQLQTPLRMKHQGHLLAPENLTLPLFFTALHRRLRQLEAHLGLQGPLELPHLETERWKNADLHWQELSRYSTRQHRHMRMGGIIGQMRLSGPALGPWWPALWLGQWLHLGKQTSMGLGRYRLFTRL